MNRKTAFRLLIASATTSSSLCLAWSVANAQEAAPPAAKAAQDPLLPKSYDGEEDFEEACKLRLNVDSLETLKEIIGLAESAIKKGLDETDLSTAKKMIATCYVQKVEALLKQIEAGNIRSQARLKKMLDEFVDDLSVAIENDPTLIEAYIIKTTLLARRNEVDEALAVADAGVTSIFPDLKKLDADGRGKLSQLIMMRAGLRSDAEQKYEDLKLSYKTSPSNLASLALLREYALRSNKLKETAQFFYELMESNPDNELLICSTAEFMALDETRTKEALDLLTAKIKQFPKSAELYRSRAKVYSVNKEPDLSIADFDEAIKLSKVDVESLLFRANLLIQAEKYEEARKDVDQAFEMDNNRVDVVLLRASIAREQKRYSDAIEDLQLILKAQPKGAAEKNVGLLMQLGLLYSQDSRPSQAIKIFDQVIKANADYWEAYRIRGDTRLSLGDHVNAISDFELALRYVPKDEEDRSGILNNLSWVLSTTPTDSIRDGKRALEYGEEACKLTSYKKPHILSTLAAAYAELGDFEKAREWSAKAVELATENEDPQLEQLEAELKSYRENKPWREKTETKENNAPIGVPGVDT